MFNYFQIGKAGVFLYFKHTYIENLKIIYF